MSERDWYEQLVHGMARSVLRSGEMRMALENTEISADALVRRAVEAAPDLICAEEIGLRSSVSAEDVLALLAVRFLSRLKRNAAMLVGGATLGAVAVQTIGWTRLTGPIIVLTLILLARFVTRAVADAPYSGWEFDSFSVARFEQRVIAPFLREQINLFTNTPEHQRAFHVTSAPGLSDLSDREQIAMTAAADRLTRVAGAMTAGSIAISGPRGVGKTTLLRDFCDSRFAARNVPELRLMVSAPVVYDFRDFVVHLYKQLCLGVVRAGQGPVRPREPARRRVVLVLPALSFVAGLAGFIYIALQHFSHVQLMQGACLLAGGSLTGAGGMAFVRSYPLRTRGADRARRALMALLAMTVMAFGVGVIYWTLAYRPHRIAAPSTRSLVMIGSSLLIVNGFVLLTMQGRRERKPGFAEEAQRQLQKIQFLQTFTTGYSGTLAIPGGAQLVACHAALVG